MEGVELLRNAKNIGNEMETYDEAVILYRGYWILASLISHYLYHWHWRSYN